MRRHAFSYLLANASSVLPHSLSQRRNSRCNDCEARSGYVQVPVRSTGKASPSVMRRRRLEASLMMRMHREALLSVPRVSSLRALKPAGARRRASGRRTIAEAIAPWMMLQTLRRSSEGVERVVLVCVHPVTRKTRPRELQLAWRCSSEAARYCARYSKTVGRKGVERLPAHPDPGSTLTTEEA